MNDPLPVAELGAPVDQRRIHLLTIAVEDYFHASALNPLVPERHWERMESRVSSNVDKTLELLDKYGHKATFFVLGWVAAHAPEVVRRIASEGHEVASKGYTHLPLSAHTRESFMDEIVRSKRVLEHACGLRLLGFRIAQGHFTLRDLWALELLSQAGYRYDSSMYPRWRSLSGQAWRRFPHTHQAGESSVMEFPLSTSGIDGFLLPTAGGNFLRQVPPAVARLSFEWWDRRYLSPFNMHFHVWELDDELPKIASADLVARVRQYRNLERMPEILGEYLAKYRFTSIADYNRWIQESYVDAPAPSQRVRRPYLVQRNREVEPITIVIPCFNEAPVLGYLENTLEQVTGQLSENYDVSYVLVDDCSTDDTWRQLQLRFSGRPDIQLVQHEVNQGVAGAILTGIRAAKSEIVCSMDADCTYDPQQLEQLIPKLADGVSMVTASPYHELGAVIGVPSWRLFLSRNLSRLYGAFLRHKFATYTACFRAYRKRDVEHIELNNTGFLGVAEMLVRLDLDGKKIAECPATLESRVLGSSKLKTLRTIFDHLKLVSSIPKMKQTAERGASASRGTASRGTT